MATYILPVDNLTVVNAVCTLAFVNPAAAPSATLEFTRAWVGQSANATSAMTRIQLETQVTAFPTLTSGTPVKLSNLNGQASVITGGTAGAAGTSGVNASAEGAGTKTLRWPDVFNNLNGWLWVPTPIEIIRLPAGFASGLGLYFPAAAVPLTNWTAGLEWNET